jgi:diaminohydroxyphosphoribosylaminopyrimidine deaminase/5-amino-6-(5-phosphoribosylamino)uracil reductase
MTEAADARFLAAAIRLGRSALGATWPNPSVGAILVKDGVVVGRGRTATGGRPHAEPQALAEAGDAARGATLYVSLEPCAHAGRGPPCVDAIVAAGVARVVTPLVDPDPRTSGGGFARLRQAAIAVEMLASEPARSAHSGHFLRVEAGRPHLTLKLAVSADDAIGRRGEGRVAVTGEIARRHARALRTRFDAILVGRGTVDADDPQLTVRLPGLESRSPVRVVLDSEGRLDESRRIFDSAAPTWVFSAGDGDPALADSRPPPPHKGKVGLGRFGVPRGAGGLDVHGCLRKLAKEGITRVLVEGGARVARAFLEADLVDEALVFRSPFAIGADRVPALAGLPLSTIEANSNFRLVERRRFGADRLTLYERRR